MSPSLEPVVFSLEGGFGGLASEEEVELEEEEVVVDKEDFLPSAIEDKDDLLGVVAEEEE